MKSTSLLLKNITILCKTWRLLMWLLFDNSSTLLCSQPAYFRIFYTTLYFLSVLPTCPSLFSKIFLRQVKISGVGSSFLNAQCVLLSTGMELDNTEWHSFSSLGKPENKSLVGLDLTKIFHISVSEDINFCFIFSVRIPNSYLRNSYKPVSH